MFAFFTVCYSILYYNKHVETSGAVAMATALLDNDPHAARRRALIEASRASSPKISNTLLDRYVRSPDSLAKSEVDLVEESLKIDADLRRKVCSMRRQLRYVSGAQTTLSDV
jgi:hypothetical protein